MKKSSCTDQTICKDDLNPLVTSVTIYAVSYFLIIAAQVQTSAHVPDVVCFASVPQTNINCLSTTPIQLDMQCNLQSD